MAKGKANKRYTGEFKQTVVEDMINNKLSYHEIMRKYFPEQKASGFRFVKQWERIYLEEGAEGLYIERRGRASHAEGVNKGRPPKLEKKVEEDLLAEVQRLRIKNEYLKKLNALVRSQQQQQNKKRW
ncbi:MAG: helix-turn-helix domain-containing protein [Oscillospiraceae bacterium]